MCNLAKYVRRKCLAKKTEKSEQKRPEKNYILYNDQKTITQNCIAYHYKQLFYNNVEHSPIYTKASMYIYENTVLSICKKNHETMGATNFKISFNMHISKIDATDDKIFN